MSRTVIRDSRSDRVFNGANYVGLSILFLLVVYPLLYVLSASFSSADAVMAGRVWIWPVGFNFEGYKAVFRHDMIMTGYMNTIFYTVVGTSINIVFTVAAAYPLSRKDFYGRNLIIFVFTFTMFFNGGIIPNYMLVRDLGIMNTRWAMLLPRALSVWNVIIARTYFQHNIPQELLEASQLDGCSDYRFIRQVVIPLSAPIVAVIGLFYAVGHWNEFFLALIYLSKESLYPLQLVLREILVRNEVRMDLYMDPSVEGQMANLRELLKYSLIVVASAPVLAIYPFAQRYFVRGIMIGAIKG
jgi:multiple sugar transport system permease protein/putative aldouronate transport system permease protein